MSSTERRQLIVKSHPGPILSKQCEILGLGRSMSYYKLRGRGKCVTNSELGTIPPNHSWALTPRILPKIMAITLIQLLNKFVFKRPINQLKVNLL